MVKITILGSCRFSPYEILAKPDPLNPAYTVATHDQFQTEEEYQRACELFYPAIRDSDLIIVYAPDGIGEHTRRDLDYAIRLGDRKQIVVVASYSGFSGVSNPFNLYYPWEYEP